MRLCHSHECLLFHSPDPTEGTLSVEREGSNSPPSADSSSCLIDKVLVLAGIPVRGNNPMRVILDTSVIGDMAIASAGPRMLKGLQEEELLRLHLESL